MKSKKLKKNSFMQGAFIATLGIVITKVLGILYVIPFYALIGDEAGSLYGYAYNIYMIFLGIGYAGIPLAMSKIISEYNTLGYYKAKKEAFNIGRRVSIILGIFCFVIMFAFAPVFAKMIIGDISGGNSIEDITFVVRVISTAILVVPVASIYRGYLQGHKYITPTSISQILEQVSRVIVIVGGSFLSLKVFNLSLKTTVGVAVFGATFGALVSFIYILSVVRKNKKQLNETKSKVEEPKISTKEVAKKLFMYAFPFVMIDVLKPFYNTIDMVTLVKTLVNSIGFNVNDAENVMGVLSTWGAKLNNIVTAIGTGIVTSLIPHLTANFVNGDMKGVKRGINKAFQSMLYVSIPMTVGLSLLSKPVWMLFYGDNYYGTITFSYSIFVALFTSIFTLAITITQLLKEYKMVFIGLISGLLIKLCLNVPLMYAFNNMGLPAFYGAITGSILGFSISAIIMLLFINKKYKVSYEDTIKELFNMIIASIIMSVVICILRLFIPEVVSSRMMNIFIILFYTIVGAIVYFIVTLKTNTIANIFGKEFINNILRKLKLRR